MPSRRPTDEARHPFRIQDDGARGRVSDAAWGGRIDAFAEGLVGVTPARAFGRVGRAAHDRRFVAASALTGVLLAALLARCVQLQVVRAADYLAQAEGNRVREQVLPAPRGVILDRRGRVLTQNVSSFMLSVIPADVPADPAERGRVLARAAELVGLLPADIDLLLADAKEGDPGVPVPVRRGVPYENAMRLAVETSRLPGFVLETSVSRSYDMSASSLAHVLGYTARVSPQELKAREGLRPVDDVGKAGIERGADVLLRGVPGTVVSEVDALGRNLSLVSRVEPVAGANLTLAIDKDLQAFVEERVRATFEATGTSKASVVAMDPASGAVRALVSLPAYDANQFAVGIDHASYERLTSDPDQPLFPRAVAGEFPSGSVFKPFVSFAALAEGIITERTSFLSTGGISVGPWYFPDWKAGGHGITDVRKALADSVNTFFYIVGGGLDQVTGLGVDRITSYAARFGFGAKTGIELPSEADGFLPSKQWKQETKGEPWYVGDTYHLAIGQGDLLVTPLQMGSAISAVANGGTTVSAHLIEGVDGGAGVPPPRPAPERLDPDLIRIVREGMRQGVTRGSSRYLSTLPFPVAGKTGTAQTPGDKPTHAWWAGFGPYEDPTLAVVILIEHGGEGSSVAVPIARDVFQWWGLYGE